MTSDFDICITRKENIIEIDGTGISINFYPKDKEKTLNGILDKCNEFNLLSPADEYFRDAKHELEIQLTQIYEEYQNKDVDSSKDQNDKDNRKSIYLQKYSTGITSLAEAIILGGKPLFLQIVNDEPSLVDKIESYDRILYPKERNSYSSEPYVFESKEEIKYYINLAKKIKNFNQIFRMVRTTFQKYVDAEDHYIIILAADTIYSYFQDKFATTHYLICIGDNSSGKNSILMTFANLGYRTLFATSVSAANVYTYLGSTEDCQGTLAEDEINNLDNDPDKMNIYKSGYSRSSGKIPKIDMHSGRVQEVFLTYCFKMFASEKSLDNSKAKGMLDRSFVIKCISGRPQYNIKDVFEKSNDIIHTKLSNELDKIRKLLLVYRLLHYDDTIKDVKLNIYNREAELTKPLIRLFRNSNEVLQELLPALSKLLDDKRKVRSNSLETKLYTAIRNLIPNHGYIIDHASIIEEIRQITHGEEIYGHQAFYSTDLGKITHRKIIDILVDKFKAERTSKGSGNEKKRALHFIEKDLIRKESEYNVPDKIEILSGDLVQTVNNEPDSFDTIFLEPKSADEVIIQDDTGTEGTQGTHLGDKQVTNDVLTNIITLDQLNKFENNIRNLLENNEQNNQADPSTNPKNMSTYPVIPSQASQSSHFLALQVKKEQTNSITDVSKPIYRLGHSDNWACNNCRQKGDIHYMKQHICNMSRK